MGASSTVSTESGRPSAAMPPKVHSTAVATLTSGNSTPRTEPASGSSTAATTANATGTSTERSRTIVRYITALMCGRPDTWKARSGRVSLARMAAI